MMQVHQENDTIIFEIECHDVTFDMSPSMLYDSSITSCSVDPTLVQNLDSLYEEYPSL